MTKLVWGDPGKRFYETGIDRGVFYPQGGVGIPWNGLIAVSEAPSGSDIRQNFYDGDKFRQQRLSESFAAKVTAYSYPRGFEEYDGYTPIGHGTQNRKMFGLSYRTKVSNDLDTDFSYLIHLIYNAVVSPANRNFSSLGSTINPITFEWDLQTIPEILPSGEFSAHLIVNPIVAYPWAVSALEDILYGTSTTTARLPSVNEVVSLFENASILRITDHGDGTWTADGPDEAIQMLTADLFEITWPSALYVDTDTYKISSL